MLISFFIMYSVMFLNVDRVEHIYLSATRCYMALLMVSPMAVLMLLFMRKMYHDRALNSLIIILSIGAFTFSLIFLRNQTFIGDKEYMRAMIPHHSSAILTSKHANIKDPEVKKLSESIIASQQAEIEQMKAILKRLEK